MEFGSPIEEKFYEAWIHFMSFVREEIVIEASSLNEFLNFPEVQPKTILHRDETNIIVQQYPIGKFKADFVLGRVAYEFATNTAEPVEVLRRLPLIVVECDGHDFHERTKEQAAYDRSRDREMAAQGYRVLRFTGSEIFRNVEKCVLDVEIMFRSMLYGSAANIDALRGALKREVGAWKSPVALAV